MAKLVILFERELRIENLALKVRNRESGSCPFTFEGENGHTAVQFLYHAARGPDGRGAGPGPLRALPGQDLRVLSTDFTCTAVPGIYTAPVGRLF